MSRNWFKNIKCVILCAGKGKRILPYSQELPKTMIPVKGKPILHYIIDYWSQYTNDFIFVVGYKKEQIIEYVKKLPINSVFIEQKELNGISDAISHVKDYVSDRFIVVLGDCVIRGNFKIEKSTVQGIGIILTENVSEIKKNYSVIIKDNKISKVEEKPRKVANNMCGVGVYLFTTKVFYYIDKTKPSYLRSEKEITDVIQNMINAGETIKPIFFKGDYLNITYPNDIKKAEKILFENRYKKKQSTKV